MEGGGARRRCRERRGPALLRPPLLACHAAPAAQQLICAHCRCSRPAAPLSVSGDAQKYGAAVRSRHAVAVGGGRPGVGGVATCGGGRGVPLGQIACTPPHVGLEHRDLKKEHRLKSPGVCPPAGSRSAGASLAPLNHCCKRQEAMLGPAGWAEPSSAADMGSCPCLIPGSLPRPCSQLQRSSISPPVVVAHPPGHPPPVYRTRPQPAHSRARPPAWATPPALGSPYMASEGPAGDVRAAAVPAPPPLGGGSPPPQAAQPLAATPAASPGGPAASAGQPGAPPAPGADSEAPSPFPPPPALGSLAKRRPGRPSAFVTPDGNPACQCCGTDLTQGGHKSFHQVRPSGRPLASRTILQCRRCSAH